MNMDFWLQLALAMCAGVGAGFGGYVAVRVDVALAVASSKAAHQRLDDHLAMQHNRRAT